MILNYHQNEALSLALEALKKEEVFVYPTDTLYGFGGDARSEKLIDKLYDLKERPEHMPVSMLVKDKDMLRDYAFCSERTVRLIDHFLPGALTLVLPAKDKALPSKLFSVQGCLGFRIPDHPFCQKLTEAFNAPIITTSVNKSGQPALNNIGDISDTFGKDIDLIVQDPGLDGQLSSSGSTVLMITSEDEVKVLREGQIPAEEIMALIR